MKASTLKNVRIVHFTGHRPFEREKHPDSICTECLRFEPNINCDFYVKRIVGECDGCMVKILKVGRKRYKMREGTYFTPGTKDDVVNNLMNVMKTQERIRIYYGDAKTGMDWGKEYVFEGRVSRTQEKLCKPILLHNKRSTKGNLIQTDCIVRIDYANANENAIVRNSCQPILHSHLYYHKKENHENFLERGGLKMSSYNRVHLYDENKYRR